MNGGALQAAGAVAVCTAEMAVFFLAVFVGLRRRQRTDAEAAACALLLPLLFLSGLFQAAFLIGVPTASIPVEVAAALFAVRTIYRHRKIAAASFGALGAGIRAHRPTAVVIGAAAAYLLLQAVAVPPGVSGWSDLAPMAFLEAQGTFFYADPLGGASLLDPLDGSLNGPILFHLLLRAGTDRGIGVLGFMAYLAVGFGTYALARRYAWPATAFTAALVVLSLPRLAVQASGPGIELMAAASALLCLLSLYRLLERPNGGDLILMVLFLLFAISGRQMPLAFPLVLAALAVLLLYRRHGGRIWIGIVSAQRGRFLAAAAAAAVFSQFWRLLARGEGTELTAAGGLVANTGGLAGALANLVRYGLESIHLTLPVEHASRWLFGFSPMGAVEGIYEWLAVPIFGQLGAAAPFRIRWLPDDALAWFGPCGFLIVAPAVAYALWRGPRRIKAIALALVVYGYLAALVPAWQPGNARLFTFFFVCGGFCTAFFLPPWRLTTAGKHVLQGVSFALIVYAAALNTAKPAVGYDRWLSALYSGDGIAAGPAMRSAVTEGFWRRMGDGRWRASAGRRLFGDDRLGRLAGLVPADRPLGVVFSRPQSIYPLLLRRPTPVVPTSAAASPAGLQAAGIEYLLFLDAPPADGVLGVGCRRLWGPSDEGALPGGLYRLDGRSNHRAVAGLYAESARMPRRKISNPASSVGFK